MPLVFRESFTSADVRGDRSALFIFRDTEQRRGVRDDVRGEVNAHGIRVQRAPSTESWALWTDDDFDRVVPIIRADLEKPYLWLSAGGQVVFPLFSMVETCFGRVPLRDSAPAIYTYMAKKIELLGLICEDIQKDQASLRALYH
jgi:hypothetical protein